MVITVMKEKRTSVHINSIMYRKVALSQNILEAMQCLLITLLVTSPAGGTLVRLHISEDSWQLWPPDLQILKQKMLFIGNFFMTV